MELNRNSLNLAFRTTKKYYSNITCWILECIFYIGDNYIVACISKSKPVTLSSRHQSFGQYAFDLFFPLVYHSQILGSTPIWTFLFRNDIDPNRFRPSSLLRNDTSGFMDGFAHRHVCFQRIFISTNSRRPFYFDTIYPAQIFRRIP